ncbi:MAG: hypothetical protein MUC62_00680 [Candidatus Thermoplasmatota archaeon]|jgi:tetratricopeptide (TPR) repeat protein|nr:hypothetical protein [Candidatus Thermoplasmatota archaeon]
MRVSKYDVILVSFDDILSRPDGGAGFDRELFIRALDVTEGSFRVYISRLYKHRLLVKNKGTPSTGTASRYWITPKGRKRISVVKKELRGCHLVPEMHMIGSKVRLLDMYRSLQDPYDRTLLLSHYISEPSFDLPSLLKDLELTRELPFLGTGTSTSCRGCDMSYHEDMLRTTIYGWYSFKMSSMVSNDRTTFLLHLADHSKCQGRLGEAEKVFKLVLAEGSALTRNQWFLASLGLVETYRRGNDLEKALSLLDDIEKEVVDPAHRGSIWTIRGNILTMKGSYEGSLDAMTKAVNVQKILRMPLLLSIAYQGRGHTYLMMGQQKMAERDLKAALRSARTARNRYSETWALIDLADIELSRKDLTKAGRFLRRAESICWESGDTCGLSWIESKWALFHLHKGEFHEALDHRKRAIEVNYPLPFVAEREHMFNELDRALGTDGAWKLVKRTELLR